MVVAAEPIVVSECGGHAASFNDAPVPPGLVHLTSDCDFSRNSHRYILWKVPLKSHCEGRCRAFSPAIQFSSNEVSCGQSCRRR